MPSGSASTPSPAAHDGGAGATTLASFFDRIDALGEDADERSQGILGALVDYATEIAPERD